MVDGGTSLAALGEFGLIAALTDGIASSPAVLVGPGDDAAVVAAPDGRVVVSCDMYLDGVHFRTDWASGEQIGRRVALAAMADICAMGAMPSALVVALATPPDIPVDLATGIGTGITGAAGQYGAVLVGGDVTRSDTLAITVTVLGDLRGAAPVLRSGAAPGEVVALAGRVGWAAAGLDVLSRGFRSPAVVVGAYRVPEPPLTAGPIAASAGATAMLDVSDGLLADLGHLARASGVRIDVSSAALPVPDKLAEVASALGRDPRAWLLTGGDDHALVATFPAETALPEPWRRIGTVLPGDGHVIDGSTETAPDTDTDTERAPDPARGLVTVDGEIFDADATAGGFDHFRRR